MGNIIMLKSIKDSNWSKVKTSRAVSKKLGNAKCINAKVELSRSPNGIRLAKGVLKIGDSTKIEYDPYRLIGDPDCLKGIKNLRRIYSNVSDELLVNILADWRNEHTLPKFSESYLNFLHFQLTEVQCRQQIGQLMNQLNTSKLPKGDYLFVSDVRFFLKPFVETYPESDRKYKQAVIDMHSGTIVAICRLGDYRPSLDKYVPSIFYDGKLTCSQVLYSPLYEFLLSGYKVARLKAYRGK